MPDKNDKTSAAGGAQTEPAQESPGSPPNPDGMGPSPPASHVPAEPRGKYLAILSLTALGVVYGDIGTSPLYAMRECFHGPHAIALTPANVLGVLSLVFWALIIVISVKYLAFVLRADNRGEGGELALMALAVHSPGVKHSPWLKFTYLALGITGASLLYGDGIITPAISVLSAVEGLNVATDVFEPYILPITIFILVGLFSMQRRGTAKVGAIFGPFVLAWFVVIAFLGVVSILQYPQVFAAINPSFGFDFFARNGWAGFLILGTVILVVTGGEALYADMGHFGRKPIRLAWFTVALPALLMNYFGQGALLLTDPSAVTNPFYKLAPGWAIYPMVVLATGATIIASQAMISGAFSITRQAVQLGYIPRIEIVHTSAEEVGQIYVPVVNWFLLFAVTAVVLTFRSSSNLAAAYGVAVATSFVITSVLALSVALKIWKINWMYAIPVAGFFLAVDLSFWGANILKIPDGGWFPIAIAIVAFTLMTTWKRGREILGARLTSQAIPLDAFLQGFAAHPPHRVAGTAVFMTGNPGATPPALMHNLKHNKVLHERVVLLTISTADAPHVPGKDRVSLEPLDPQELGMWRVTAVYGFMENPSVPEILGRCKPLGLETNLMETTFFLGRETLIPTRRKKGMALWREFLFALMARNARSATAFFKIPPNRVVELGSQVEI